MMQLLSRLTSHTGSLSLDLIEKFILIGWMLGQSVVVSGYCIGHDYSSILYVTASSSLTSQLMLEMWSSSNSLAPAILPGCIFNKALELIQ